MAGKTSPRILKANSARHLGSNIVFDYSDLRQQCDAQLQQARQQAERILADANSESEAVRLRAHEEGRTAGLREGLSHAAEKIERISSQRADEMALEKLQTTFPAIQAAATAMVHERDRWLAQWESAAVGLAVAIAEKILHRQLKLSPEISTELMRETLDLIVGSSQLKLRMHPQDVALLGQHADDVVRAASRCGDVEIESDPSVTRGGCIIETQHGTIDAQLETQLERIMSELVEQNS